ncbi:MAG: hypothetical protein H6622_13970 [Halobacteriovoraceae bacterium]|nr:hypothetical protein [Halobacteriovoraceae bacterium]
MKFVVITCLIVFSWSSQAQNKICEKILRSSDITNHKGSELIADYINQVHNNWLQVSNSNYNLHFIHPKKLRLKTYVQSKNELHKYIKVQNPILNLNGRLNIFELLFEQNLYKDIGDWILLNGFNQDKLEIVIAEIEINKYNAKYIDALNMSIRENIKILGEIGYIPERFQETLHNDTEIDHDPYLEIIIKLINYLRVHI